MLVLCCLQCHPLLVEKLFDIVGKFPQPEAKNKVSEESVCKQVCNVPPLHLGHSFFLTSPLR